MGIPSSTPRLILDPPAAFSHLITKTRSDTAGLSMYFKPIAPNELFNAGFPILGFPVIINRE